MHGISNEIRVADAQRHDFWPLRDGVLIFCTVELRFCLCRVLGCHHLAWSARSELCIQLICSAWELWFCMLWKHLSSFRYDIRSMRKHVHHHESFAVYMYSVSSSLNWHTTAAIEVRAVPAYLLTWVVWCEGGEAPSSRKELLDHDARARASLLANIFCRINNTLPM